MNIHNDYIEKLQAQLDEWDAQIKLLRAEAEKYEAEARIEYHKQVEQFDQHKQQLQQQMEALQEAGEQTWKDLQQQTDNHWDSLNQSLRSFMNQFKS